MTSNAEWRVTHTSRGAAAAIRGRGSMRAKRSGVRDQGHYVEVRHGAERIAVHCQAVRRHQVVTKREHHEDIPLGNKSMGKTLIHIQQSAPMLERRPLAAYESLAGGA
jgi:hypothetical protein